jgi:methylenetetrahydrofolate reductase (NADPH)
LETFRQALSEGRFAICSELTLRRESTADDVRRQADLLGRYSDGIQVTDNPYAWVQMSALSAAGILADHGFDPVPIMTCRDRNRSALESDLRGLQALGVTSLLLIRGHRVPADHAVPSSTVFDLTGRELIALAASLGAEQGDGGFLIGTGARLFRPNRGWRADSLTARGAAGARFIQTQLCFNMDILRQYMKRFIAAGLPEHYGVIVSLSPLPSAQTAKWVKRNMADSRIPESVIDRLETADDPEKEGIRICAELMQQVSEVPGVSGVNLMTTGTPEAIPAAIKASGLRS